MSFSHPRRTTKTPSSSALTPSESSASGRPSVNTNMSLQKGATFHSPTTSDRELPYHFKVPALPRRSETTLEDVVDAHKRRVALTLGDIDRSLAAVEETSTKERSPFRDEADPVSQSFLDHTVGSPALRSYGSIMDSATTKGSSIGKHSLRPRHNRRPSRYSDSALGSSIGSSNGKKAAETPATSEQSIKSVKPSAITRTVAHSSTIQSLPRLSSRANNRIHEHILRPLLAKPSLKEFHPIVKDCPRRIHNKEIVCLRDLEKTLIFMAPERTKSAALYLDFCLTSIRCIQATVEFLNEREQTRPHDRPYTNGYFVDLVDQIKQYAQQVQAAKEKESKGEELDEMDPESTDEVKLYGGLTKNGRPAELVRIKKNGKAISIATGEPVDMDDEDSKESIRFKRSLSEEAEDDEAIMRSMARRKKSASAAELAPKRCREPGCNKEFKRPCDLTKHEKTHSRPWKCPVATCKYHEYGWPTEKEMDRHHNDKHSAAPPLYECHFKPCPYKSKRESNCKQHMEKAHNWEYVRSKNNGKTRPNGSTGAQSIVNGGLPTPQSTNMRTPSSDGMGVATPPEDDDFDMEAIMYNNNHLTNYQQYPTDLDMFTNQELTLEYSPITENRSGSGSSAGHSPFVVNSELASDNFDFNDYHPPNNNNNVDFSLFEQDDIYSANVQLPTPTHDVFSRAIAQFETSGVPFQSDPIPHISPVGQGNTMLYTPTSLREVDEGFEDFAPNNHQINNGSGDFQLFPSSNSGSGTISSSAPSALFGEMPRGFPGVSAQELLDFYAATTAAATAGHHQQYQPIHQPIQHQQNLHQQNLHQQNLLHQQQQHNQYASNVNLNMNMNMSLDWSSDDSLSAGYRSH